MSETEKHTPTPWGWYAEDSSMAILCGQGGSDPFYDHVLSVSPCQACQERTPKDQGWTWNRCTTPNQVNAEFIVRACNSHDKLLTALEALKLAVSAYEDPSIWLEQAKEAIALAASPQPVRAE